MKTINNKGKMKLLEFTEYTHPVELKVVRNEADGGDVLGLSEKALIQYSEGLTQMLVNALQEAYNKKILPRSIEFTGEFKINGRYFTEDE